MRFTQWKKIDLTQKEFALLVYLLRNKGRVVSRIDIARKGMGYHFRYWNKHVSMFM